MTRPESDVPVLTDCFDCGVTPGGAHEGGCDIARCHATGGQRLGCPGSHDLDGVRISCHPDVWSGLWPGEAECREYGLMMPPGFPDLNRLMSEGVWSVRRQRWLWPR